MAAEMPVMSAITFLIFAWLIISWPFRMPPSSSPMITSTIAISTRVKPACAAFLSLRTDGIMGERLLQCESASEKSNGLEVLAHQVLIDAGFHVGRRRARGSGSGGRTCGSLQLGANLAGARHAIVHLSVDRARDLLRKVREADDQAGKAHAVGAADARLHADKAPAGVRRQLPGRGSGGRAGDEAGDAQMLPEQVGFRGGVGVVVQAADGAVAVAARRSLYRPARRGVEVVTG